MFKANNTWCNLDESRWLFLDRRNTSCLDLEFRTLVDCFYYAVMSSHVI